MQLTIKNSRNPIAKYDWKPIAALLLLNVHLCVSQTQLPEVLESKPLTIGLAEKIKSVQLGETRTINIYLPEDYNPKDTVTYPVIYIPDGGLEEDFIHITGIVRYNTQPWIARFKRSIVVGIENTNRRRDFTFAVENLDFVEKIGFKKTQFPAYGGSEKYIAFLEKELQPYLRARYKANAQRTLIGESLAGLLATEILLKHRNLFDHYVIITPSLWWGDGELLRRAPALLQSGGSKPVSVYLAACNKDEDKGMYDAAVSLRDILQNTPKLDFHYDYLPDELHSTAIHQAVYNAFKAFYPKTIYQK
jgi:predicted alpha/beta superfamily hydrolase